MKFNKDINLSNKFTHILKLSLLFFLFQLSQKSYSQMSTSENGEYQIDSIITTTYWYYVIDTNKKVEIIYDHLNQLKFELTYVNVSQYPYDSVEIIWELWDRTTINRNEQNQIISEIYESKENTEQILRYTFKHEFEYNPSTIIKTFSEWIWYDSLWVPAVREIDSVFSSDQYEASIRQHWNIENSVWDNFQRKNIDYHDDGKINYDKMMYWAETDFSDTGSIKVYDYSFYPDTTIMYRYDKGGRVDVYKTYFNSDSSRKYHITYQKYYDTLGHIPTDKDIEVYNELHWLLSKTNYDWRFNESVWSFHAKLEYDYDEYGRVNTFNDYLSDSVSPRKITLYDYYEENDLLKTKKHYWVGWDTNQYTIDNYYYSTPDDIKEDNVTSKLILVFPNPTSFYLHIVRSAENNYSAFKIYNLSGKQVLTGNLNKGTRIIDVSSLKHGLYIIGLENQNKVVYQKIIVE